MLLAYNYRTIVVLAVLLVAALVGGAPNDTGGG